MRTDDVFAQKVGLVALTQAEMDEWLVQVLIELLHPLSVSRVQLLVGQQPLSRKISLVKALAKESGIPQEEEISSPTTLKSLLGAVSKRNSERDKVVHSYYEQTETNQKRRFRSREQDDKDDTVDISEIDELITGIRKCNEELSSFVDLLEKRREEQASIETAWAEAVRSVHELIVAGHLQERQLLSGVTAGVRTDSLIHVRIRGISREFTTSDAVLDDGDFLAEIDPKTWQAVITASSGEKYLFGDTGWRNVTEDVKEEYPEVRFAAIRRIADSVQIRSEGDKVADLQVPETKNHLAERAFGSAPKHGVQVPLWVNLLAGFRPDDKE